MITLPRTLEILHRSLLEGKLPRNLSWATTVDLIGRLGEVERHYHNESVLIGHGTGKSMRRTIWPNT